MFAQDSVKSDSTPVAEITGDYVNNLKYAMFLHEESVRSNSDFTVLSLPPEASS